MAFDGLFTHYILEETKKDILNGKINKIYQISNYELIFMIRSHKKNNQLLISIHPNYARFHLSEENYPTPQEPPMFCMLLRKHLEGGIITDINQKGLDRIIEFTIESFNEMGDKEKKLLIVEIMGKHSNIILVNENRRILDAIKRISPFLNSFRTLQPGAYYQYPPADDKVNFLEADKYDFSHFSYDKDLAKQLVNYFEGLSPISAKELIYETILNEEGLYNSYLKFKNNLNNIKPTITITEKKEAFYLFPLQHLKGENKYFDSLGEMLDRFYFNKENKERVKQQTADLEQFIKKEYEKNLNKLNHLETDLLMAKDALKYQKYGELIIASLYQLQKGFSQFTTYDYDTEEEITIELDPHKTPIENAQKYFTKYQKAKKAITHLNEQIKLTKDEIEYFALLLDQIENATINDALEIRQELEEGKYLKPHITKQKAKQKPQYETYYIEGATIYVGKNNLQNEYITHKLASKNDYFMHVKDMPGAHVIIKVDKELTENIIRTAANLAAYYSKGKYSSSVPVDYTLVKYVKKIPKSFAGFVTYSNQKTIYIDPNEDLIHSLVKK
ncbi:MAG TPA: NFACT RNA binding domain-containing protein [Haloplasmataceae bacterium]